MRVRFRSAISNWLCVCVVVCVSIAIWNCCDSDLVLWASKLIMHNPSAMSVLHLSGACLSQVSQLRAQLVPWLSMWPETTLAPRALRIHAAQHILSSSLGKYLAWPFMHAWATAAALHVCLSIRDIYIYIYIHIYIYMHAVKLLSGPSLGFLRVIIWSKLAFERVIIWSKFAF